MQEKDKYFDKSVVNTCENKENVSCINIPTANLQYHDHCYFEMIDGGIANIAKEIEVSELNPDEDMYNDSLLEMKLNDCGDNQMRNLENTNFETQSDSIIEQISETNNNASSLQMEQVNHPIAINEIESLLPLTKKGTVRKRKPKMDKDTKEKIKKIKFIEKHPIRDAPCMKLDCKLKCIHNIPQSRRSEIHKEFVNMSWKEQKNFLTAHIAKLDVKRHYTDNEIFRKNKAVKYYLLNSEKKLARVCKSFFLTTLGYHEKNDSPIYNILSQKNETNFIIKDGRGKTPSANKLDHQPIISHIESFNPTISHYRREHAPNVLYLPSDINVTIMLEDFKNKHPQMNISYDLYRKIVKSMRIHFTKLGHEECEKCEDFNLHDKNHLKSPENYNDCSGCVRYLKHMKNASLSREAYRLDVNTNFKDTIYVSVDLQKVIMLPRIDTFKTVLFTRRLIVYHESFVKVGVKQKNLQPYSVIWHEAIAGRNKEEIISTYYSFFLLHRDVKKFVIWADNCAAQDKNWAFFSFLVNIVNSDEISAEEIIIKYFEPGHSFMSANSFHHLVEKSLKSQGKIYDFNDFEDAIKKANSGKVTIKSMQHWDFYPWKDYSSNYKLSSKKYNSEKPYLSNIMCVRAIRGLKTLNYKSSYDGQEVKLDFLNKNATNHMEKPASYSAPCGISESRKKEIIEKLGHLMPSNRLLFWKNLSTLPN